MGFYHDMCHAIPLLLLTKCSEGHMGLAGPELRAVWLRLCYYYYLLYAGCLYLYSWDKLCPYVIQCCSYSVVTIHGVYIISFSVESIVFYISTFRSTCAVPNMAVFCSSLTSCFLGMLLMFIIVIIIIARRRADKSLCQYGLTVSTTVHWLMSFDLSMLSCVRCYGAFH